MFTGHDLSEGAPFILSKLKKVGVKASFFLTGDYLRNPQYSEYIKRMIKDKHYIGPHSDKHLLYMPWSKRDSLLVSEEEFKTDLIANMQALSTFKAVSNKEPFYIPSYEWYNKQIVDWGLKLGLKAVNYTPGLRTAADYTYPEMGSRYVSTEEIESLLWLFEERNTLNGSIILIHMGTDPRRKDKLYKQLPQLIKKIQAQGYAIVDIPTLLTKI